MDWYYAEGGQRFGPFPDDTFQQMIFNGQVRPTTLVWHEGMTDWKEYQHVAGAEAGPDYSKHSACSQCGRVFPAEDMIHYQGSYVCAACKPLFFQRLHEAGAEAAFAYPQEMLNYAGFWIRVGAAIIDGIILAVVQALLKLVVGLVFGLGTSLIIDEYGGNSDSVALGAGMLGNLLDLAIGIFYATYFVGRHAATPGKMACGIKVVCADGSRVSYLRAFGRYWAKMLSGLTCGVGFIMAGFDSEKRALHDYICTTRVVYK